MEDANAGGARHLVGMLTDALNWLKAEVVATVLAPGVLDPGAVQRDPDLLQAAYRAGGLDCKEVIGDQVTGTQD
jgi:hypothetical protein